MKRFGFLRTSFCTLAVVIVLVLGLAAFDTAKPAQVQAQQQMQLASPIAQIGPANPVVWKSPYVHLASGNFYIRIGNQFFRGNNAMRLTSNPGTDKTTFEAVWTEHNVEMRLNMYFQINEYGDWDLYELRSYNGATRGDWIFYSEYSENVRVGGAPGQPNFASYFSFQAKNGIDAEIFCGDCSIAAFMQQPLQYSEQGYALEIMSGLPANETITVAASTQTGYGVNALLRDRNGNVVTNQEGMMYLWQPADPSIVSVSPQNIRYAGGGCAYGIQEPCPMMNGQVSGLKPGVTFIHVDVMQGDTLLATQTFYVKVIAPITHPTPSSSPTASSPSYSSPTPTATPSQTDEQLRQEVEALKGTIGEIQLDVAKQQSDLNVLQRFMRRVRTFLQGLFGKTAAENL